jgi:lipopolysaccharide/colanic/teichoic acid biosynthesis glycosyltransferase
MNLIVIHQNKNPLPNNTGDLLRFAVCSEPLASITLSCLNANSHPRGNNETIAIPQDWVGQLKTTKGKSGIIYYKDKIPVSLGATNCLKAKPWFIVSNGRFVTRIDHQWLCNVLAELHADVVAVNVSPQLQAGQEKVLTNSQGKLVGFRRFYDDSAQAAPIPDDWPHHLFIKTDILKKLLDDDTLPLSFTKFINNCFSNSLTVCCLNIGGTVSDLGTEEGLLGFVATRLNSKGMNHHNPKNGHQKEILGKDGIEISTGVRLFGKVLFGQDVSIGPNAIIVGPTIIGNSVKIAKGAVVRASIVDSGVSVPPNSVLQNRVLINGQKLQKQTMQAKNNCMAVITNGIETYKNSCANNFRTWPRYSYVGCAKRIADIVTSVVVLVLFAPVFPIIAVIIKLTSRGPVFFKDIRQGLHGKVFNCLKFRTMLVGANNLQDKLRILNQADGPQFKMADDPRLSIVGKFLRDTYIDEIPQFFNVLLGQMSVVGPRPSPESENTLCPPWRDARLSVRPGITGLWQVCSTRQPMRDFQEWIHYDTKYVKDLSLRTDLWICWKTAEKLIKNFVSQF